MSRKRSLINRSAVKSRFAAAGYRTSREVLDHLEAVIGAAIKAGIRGMQGRGKVTVTAEEVARGKFMGDPASPPPDPASPPKRRVSRGLLRR